MKNVTKIQFVIILGLLVVIIFLIYSLFFNTLKTRHEVDPTLVSLDTFTTNVQGGEFNYLKMDLTLKINNTAQKSDLISKKSQIRRLILNIATSQDGRWILQNKGKEELKQTIQNEISKDFGINVQNVYITDFVLAD